MTKQRTEYIILSEIFLQCVLSFIVFRLYDIYETTANRFISEGKKFLNYSQTSKPGQSLMLLLSYCLRKIDKTVCPLIVDKRKT